MVLALPPTDEGATHPRVVACTESLLYVVKPAGIHTVALTPGQADCLSVWVGREHPECAAASEDPREAGAVHRLDRDTSGVVAFARSRAIWERARAAFEDGEVGKRYVAVCEAPGPPGWPPRAPDDALPGWLEPASALADPVALECEPLEDDQAWRIRAPIGRGPDRGSMSVRLDGQRATTVVQARGRAPGGLVCELELLTGRRHQARVHLAWVGLPIRGDARYGPAGAGSESAAEHGAPRLRLHAARLDLSRRFPDETPVTAAPDPSLFGP
jgi:23S rRNA pseudouridine1911/1915/1917 synthase